MNSYKDAIENTNIVSKTDVDGIITYVNDEFCELSGYSKEELIGKNHNIIRHPDTPKEYFEELWSVILSGKVHKGTIKNLKKNGESFWTNTTIIPIICKGKICEFVAIRFEVSKIYELNEELNKTKKELLELNQNLENIISSKTKELKELNKNLENRINQAIELNNKQQKIIFQQNRQVILGQMLENIAHQWRQPLNELSLNLYLFNQEKNESLKQKYYKHSQDLIQSMSNTINDFYNFIKPNVECDNVSIIKILKESLKITHKSLKTNNIKLHFKICEYAKNNKIQVYANELVQVFVNLFNNSKDAFLQANNKENHIYIVIEECLNNIILYYKDNAGGASDEVLDNIFDPYFSTKHKAQGVGLGLYICKQILNKIEAKIDCYNEDDGLCFKIVFKG